jgi:hypothetical protein
LPIIWVDCYMILSKLKIPLLRNKRIIEASLKREPSNRWIECAGPALGRCKQLFQVGPPIFWGLESFLIFTWGMETTSQWRCKQQVRILLPPAQPKPNQTCCLHIPKLHWLAVWASKINFLIFFIYNLNWDFLFYKKKIIYISL